MRNTDYRLSTSFAHHPKTIKLMRRLNADGVLAFVFLLGHVAQLKSDGKLTGMDAEDISIAAQWHGEPEIFVNELLKVGFLEKGSDGVLSIHDWADHNPWAVGAAARSEKAKKAAQKRWGTKPGNAPSNAPSISEQCKDSGAAMPQHAKGNAPSPSPSPIPKDKKHCASPAADAPDDEPFYLTKRRRKLKGQQLTWFEQFWETFAYRRGKAAAGDVWMDIRVTQALVPEILAGAKRTAAERPALQRSGKTPKFPQGWLSERRWEDDPETPAGSETQVPKTDRYWRDKAQGLPGYRPDMTWTECRDLASNQGGAAA